MKTNPSNYTNHSGGAVGSDSTFDIIGRKKGFTNHKHYYHGKKTPMGNTEISEDELEEGWKHVLMANKVLQRQPQAYKDLLSRNWQQVKNSEAIFAISEINANNKEVSGGTGWAVQMAIDVNKPVYVFDQKIGLWNKYNQQSQRFETCPPPVLTKNFAGIGTRKLNEVGLQAITKLYDDTLLQNE